MVKKMKQVMEKRSKIAMRPMMTLIRPQKDWCCLPISASLTISCSGFEICCLPFSLEASYFVLKVGVLLNQPNCEFHRLSNIVKDPSSGFQCSITYPFEQTWQCCAAEYSWFRTSDASFLILEFRFVPVLQINSVLSSASASFFSGCPSFVKD